MAVQHGDYYVSHAPKLLRQFDRHFPRVERRLAERYGAAFASEVRAETRRRFEDVLPELPYIGGRKNYFTPVMIINGWIVSLFRAMKARGKDAEETVGVCSDAADDFFGAIPDFALKLFGRAAFSRMARGALRRQAERSQRRRHDDDFVYEFTEGDGDDYDWSLEFSECAVNKFYDAQGTEELKPYCNFFDVSYSRLMGMGVDAHRTIGLGCGHCTLAYKHGRETEIPERLVGVRRRGATESG